ncbi:hypothetical protein FHS15_004117 [Paenibacillus castaneae]|uniref:hypothetical protein n=1 Tax=Paenibacillus castaneae TaxID=474957 RepID=UPI000C9C6CA0|nr:hypothetical protein [Paenibacillus castaneae]NIK78971.1 hypothetical protein [Paenibacillus castaneae]
MEHEVEIQKLKERLDTIESLLQHKPKSSNALKFVIGFIIVFILLLITIGVIQFIAASSS